MADLTPVWIGLVGTIFGGVGLKLTDTWLTRQARKEDSALQMRNELRGQIDVLKADLAAMQREIEDTEAKMDEWREKYWVLREEYAKVREELVSSLRTIKKATEDTS